MSGALQENIFNVAFNTKKQAIMNGKIFTCLCISILYPMRHSYQIFHSMEKQRKVLLHMKRIQIDSLVYSAPLDMLFLMLFLTLVLIAFHVCVLLSSHTSFLALCILVVISFLSLLISFSIDLGALTTIPLCITKMKLFKSH